MPGAAFSIAPGEATRLSPLGSGKSETVLRSAFPINYTCFSQNGAEGTNPRTRTNARKPPLHFPGGFPWACGQRRGTGQLKALLTAPAPDLAAGLIFLKKKGLERVEKSRPRLAWGRRINRG